jgi:dTDP-4-dehydrorhamnose reductase
MKVLVTGVTGQLGYDVVRFGKVLGLDILGVGSDQLDVTNKKNTECFIFEYNPDVLIHCAAYTAVDNAEDNKVDCWKVNVEGTRNLCNAMKKINAKFMYISTDYVFDGKKQVPYQETDKPEPINYYGYTKLHGEKIVAQLLEKYFILRTSWVFGINGKNFVKTMLRLGEEKGEVSVVADQVGSPTYTCDLAQLILELVQSSKYGIYHASNVGYCSWYEFAKEIFRQMNMKVNVNHILTQDYLTRASRPKNSRLYMNNLQKNGFKLLPTWQNALERFLKELKTGEILWQKRSY